MLSSRNQNILLLCFFIMAIFTWQGLKVFFYFGDLGNIFNQTGLYHVDFPLFKYEMVLAKAFFAKSGQLWGYDPFYLAGYPLSFLWNSNVIYQVSAVLLPTVPEFILIKLSLLGIIIFEPLLLYWGLRHFAPQIDRKVSLLATIVMLLLLRWGQATIFLTVGMTNGYFIYLYSFFAASLLLRFCGQQFSPGRWLQLTLVFSLGLLIHKTFALLLLSFSLLSLYFLLQKRQFYKLTALALAALFSLAVNLFWILPSLSLNTYLDFSFNPFWRDLGQTLKFYDVFTAGKYFFSSTFILHLILTALATFGYYTLKKKGENILFYHALTALLVLLLLIFLNQFKAFEWLHGSRFLLCFVIFSLLPATFGLAALKMKNWQLFSVGLGLLMVLPLLPNVENHVKRIIGKSNSAFVYQKDLRTLELEQVAEYIKKNTGTSSAIFMQNRFSDEHLLVLFGIQTKRRFINAPYKYIYLKHNYLNRYLQDYLQIIQNPGSKWPQANTWPLSEKDFSEIISFLNIEWFFIYDSTSQEKIEKVVGMQRVTEVGSYAVFRNTLVQPAIVGGGAKLQVDYNEIKVLNIPPEKKELIIKMHWLKTMQVKGAQKIKPYYMKRYRLPFIKVENVQSQEVSIRVN